MELLMELRRSLTGFWIRPWILPFLHLFYGISPSLYLFSGLSLSLYLFFWDINSSFVLQAEVDMFLMDDDEAAFSQTSPIAPNESIDWNEIENILNES